MFSYVTLDTLQKLKVLRSLTDHLEQQHSGEAHLSGAMTAEYHNAR